MSDLQELLNTRESVGSGAILEALRDGLSSDPADSGSAEPLHRLVVGYFAIEDVAVNSSHRKAFRKQPEAARGLLAILEEDGEDSLATLMRSLIDGKPRPLGALAEGLKAGAAEASKHGAGIRGALEAFASVALRSPATAADLEMSLGWVAVEEGLVDRVCLHHEELAFQHGPGHRKALGREAALDALVEKTGIGGLLRAVAEANGPRILARETEWDEEQDGPAEYIEVPVQHKLHAGRLGPALRLGDSKPARDIKALYAVANGAELFVPTKHKPREPGLFLIPDSAWDAEREHVMRWLEIGVDDADDIPTWAQSVIPFAVLPGDASRWVVALEGPFAGAVMLGHDDIHEGHVRYPSLAHFLAALRLFPHEIVGNGGYVSYTVTKSRHVVYPMGYRETD